MSDLQQIQMSGVSIKSINLC